MFKRLHYSKVRLDLNLPNYSTLNEHTHRHRDIYTCIHTPARIRRARHVCVKKNKGAQFDSYGSQLMVSERDPVGLFAAAEAIRRKEPHEIQQVLDS